MDDLFVYIIVWSFAGALITPLIAKLKPHWEAWKIHTVLILSGPLVWALMLLYIFFVEKKD